MRIDKIVIYPFMVFLVLLGLLELSGCTGNTEPEPAQGKIGFTFNHVVEGNPVVFDTMIYQNAAGNQYLVNEIQYFVSDFTLWQNGHGLMLDKWEDIHYVDTDIPDTWSYQPADDIPEGSYDSLTFIFGISEEKNQSFMFVNPPESFMFWPEYLGGGYHYMKLNGKWKDPEGIINPFNFHLGIGQIYDNDGNITGFIQNYFTVHLPGSSFTISNGETTHANITMHINEWFNNPNIFDFNYWGGNIMENQAAMHSGIENGHNVFSIEFNR